MKIIGRESMNHHHHHHLVKSILDFSFQSSRIMSAPLARLRPEKFDDAAIQQQIALVRIILSIDSI